MKYYTFVWPRLNIDYTLRSRYVVRVLLFFLSTESCIWYAVVLLLRFKIWNNYIYNDVLIMSPMSGLVWHRFTYIAIICIWDDLKWNVVAERTLLVHLFMTSLYAVYIVFLWFVTADRSSFTDIMPLFKHIFNIAWLSL